MNPHLEELMGNFEIERQYCDIVSQDHIGMRDASQIKDFIRLQKEIWSRVPYLALMADGRTGYSGTLSTAYNQGVWRFESSLSNFYLVGVDCDNGELVNPAFPNDSVTDLQIRALNLHEIDARQVVGNLYKASQLEYPSYYTAQKQDAWREEKRRALNLKEVFVRSTPIPGHDFSNDDF